MAIKEVDKNLAFIGLTPNRECNIELSSLDTLFLPNMGTSKYDVTLLEQRRLSTTICGLDIIDHDSQKGNSQSFKKQHYILEKEFRK